MSTGRRKTERLTDDEIIDKLRRFGPLTTARLCVLLGMSTHSSNLKRLKRCRGITRDLIGHGNVWRVA